MKHPKILFLCATVLCPALCVAQATKKTTHIIGEVHGSTVDFIEITRVEDDARVNDSHEIPFKNGRFTFDYSSNELEALEITAWLQDGSGRYADFFAEGDTVRIKLYADDAAEMRSSTPLNTEWNRFNQETKAMMAPLIEERKRLEKAGLDLTPEARLLKEKMLAARESNAPDSVLMAISEQAGRMMEEGKFYTSEYADLNDKINEAVPQVKRAKMEYARRHADPVGLLTLFNISKNSEEKEQEVIKIYQEVFADKMPDFHLSDYMSIWCASRQIRVGGTYFDFTAPDLNGKDHRLSEEISGKLALIDLWASWCGSCRRKAQSMIPVYEEYKDKGFTIVGVAREREEKDMRIALEKEKYPWLNLLELRDRAKIWRHYGAGNAGGKTILVDTDGTILAIDPDADEVKSILESKFKQ